MNKFHFEFTCGLNDNTCPTGYGECQHCSGCHIICDATGKEVSYEEYIRAARGE